MAWRLANSLITLRNQINAAYPNRNKDSDGTIGDPAHAATKSEHNPNAAGVVTAMDITHDPKNNVHGGDLAEALNDDNRTWYVIWNRKIWDIKWIPYWGKNPHDRHVHISTNQSASRYDDGRNWNIIKQEADMKANADFVNKEYTAKLGRVPNPGEADQWVGRDAGEVSLGIYESQEARNYRDKINNFLVIKDTNHEYARWDKLHKQILGRNQPDREVFKVAAVGKTWLNALEILSDHIEAPEDVANAEVGKIARQDNWEGQINDLTKKVEEQGKVIAKYQASSGDASKWQTLGVLIRELLGLNR